MLFVAISFAGIAQITEDFEGYNAGEQLVSQAVGQGIEYWTTWSETPGSTEDPIVSSDVAFSGTNSVLIEGTNDCVLLLGDQTQGAFNLEMNVYVPNGFFGYFNVLQAFAGTSSEWGMQAFFDAGGVGSVDAGGEGAGAFTYNYDTWMTVKIFVDLDADFAEMFIDGTSIVTWVWSSGSFGTGTLNQLGAMNFYAWADNGTPKIYFDDINVSAVTTSEIVEDFESYNADEKLVEQALAQGLDYWTCWSGDSGAGGDEDPTVSTEQVFTGDNSVMIDGTNDFVMLFGDKTAGKYAVDFYMYVPSGFVGYYNLLQAWGAGGTGATWGLEIYFNPGGIAEITAEGTTGIETFNYAYDTWFHVENIINLNMDEATLMIDGTEILTWEWSVGASGGGINQLAAMDIYAASTNGTPKFFMDDIQLIELEPPVGPPTIGVDPVSFTVDLDAGASTTETLEISNGGIAPMDWSAYPQYSMGKSLKGAEYNRAVDFKSIEIPEISISKGLGYPAPENSDLDITLNYDSENANSVGLTSGGTFEFGAKFPVEMVSPYVSMEIFEIQVWVNDIVTNSVVRVYGHGYDDAPAEVLAEQEFTSIIGWNNVLLDSPVSITGGDIWVTCEVSHDEGLFPAGSDAGPWVTNGDWFKSGASWVPMHEANPDLDGNWNVRAVATGDPMDGWIVIDPANGELDGGDSESVSVTFDASDLSAGTYNANIMVNSNDPVTPTAMVPVTLTVTGSGNLMAPENLVGEIAGSDAELSWTAPGAFDPEWITYSAEAISNSIGTNAAAEFDVAARWEPASLEGFDNGAVTKINFVPGEPGDMCTYTLKVWQGSGSPSLVYSQVLTEIVPDVWNEVTLDTPVAFDNGEELWIGFGVNTTAGYPAGCDDGPQVEGYSNMMYWNGEWTTLSALNETLIYNWAVQGYIELAGKEVALPQVVETPATINNAGALALNPVKMTPPAIFVPESAKALLGYNVYRNNAQINENVVTETMYTDVAPGSGLFTYYVTAVYDEGESGASNTVTLDFGGGTPNVVAQLDYEDVADWSLTFDPWTSVDVDMQTTYGFTGITFPNSGSAMAYIAFNPETTDPPMSDDPEIQPHAGERFGAVFASVPAATGNDDWIISPQVALGTQSEFNFWAKSYTSDYGLERFNVGVSTTGMDPEDFEIISGSSYLEAPVAWTEYNYDISAYDGQVVYVGIQCVSYDAFVFMTDDITVSTVPSSIEEGETAETFSIYPNPAQNFVNISGISTMKSVKVLNLTGQVVYSNVVNGQEVQINTGDMAEGMYLIQIETENGTSSQKLIIE